MPRAAGEKGEIVRYISGVADGFTVAQRQLADRPAVAVTVAGGGGWRVS